MSEQIDRDMLLNPEAVGDPSQTPIVQLSDGAAAYFERARCPECRLINHCHEDDCTRKPYVMGTRYRCCEHCKDDPVHAVDPDDHDIACNAPNSTGCIGKKAVARAAQKEATA